MQYMTAALNTAQTVALIVVPVLLVQWALSFVCLMRLYKNKPRRLKTGVWNIVVLFGLIIGPVLYLLTEKPNARYPKTGGAEGNRNSAENGEGTGAEKTSVDGAKELADPAKTAARNVQSGETNTAAEKPFQDRNDAENRQGGGDYMI